MDGLVNVTAHGARGDGETLNTAAIQKALDAAGAAGGGVVLVPPGDFLTGTLHLRSGVTLQVAAGGVLRGSPRIEDYPPTGRERKKGANVDNQPHHLILADGCRDVGLAGPGTIDGSGPAFWDPPTTCAFFTRKERRPSPMIELHRCRNVRLNSLVIANSPGWTVHVVECDNVRIRGVDIRNSLIGPNTDGLDITDSRDVIVSDCNIVCGDDSIVLKSYGGVNERILVTNCVCETNCSALKLGASESLGTMRRIAMSNCVVHNSSRGISLYNLAGGTFEDVTFSNIVIDAHTDMPLVCPIHINLSHYPEAERDRGIGVVRNVRISDVLVRSDARILLTAQDGAMLENISLSGIHMDYPAVEDRFEQAAKAFSGQFSPFSPEARGARACVAACNIRNLVLRDVSTTWPADAAPLHFLWARNVRGGLVDCPLGTASRGDLPPVELIDCDLDVRAPEEKKERNTRLPSKRGKRRS
jgi:hypothetical protein